MQQNGRGNLHVPGQMPIAVQPIPTPHAHPTVAVLQGSQGLTMLVAGGLNKLEWMAGQALAGGHTASGAAEIAYQTLERVQEIAAERHRQHTEGESDEQGVL